MVFLLGCCLLAFLVIFFEVVPKGLGQDDFALSFLSKSQLGFSFGTPSKQSRSSLI